MANNTKRKFSAKEFVENLVTNGESAKCDQTSPAFERPLIPEYYDDALYKKGQKFFFKNMIAIILGKLLGLLAVGSQNTATSVLVMTNESTSNTSAYRRYVATIFHMLIWYEDDFGPNSRLKKSLIKIRNMHNVASNRASSALSYRISQKDMAMTQFAFMGFPVCRARITGIHHATDDELRGFIHIWKVVGYVLGMEEQFNLCRDSLKETRAICNEMIDRLLIPATKQKDPLFLKMSAYIVNGMSAIMPLLEHKIFLFLTDVVLVDDISQVSNKNAEFKKFTPREKFKLRFIVNTLNWLQYSFVRIITNYLQMFLLFMTRHFPILAIIRYGWKTAYVKI